MARNTWSGLGRRGWLAMGLLGAAGLAWTAGARRLDADRGVDAINRGSPGAASLRIAALPSAALDRRAAPAELDGSEASRVAADSPSHVALKPIAGDDVPVALEAPIARALRAIEACQAKHDQVRDYVCTFTKRERIDGRLTEPHIMLMKARTQPHSVYLKFRQPAAGREAIYVEGRHRGKVLAHDVGLGRLLAGTLHLDPRGSRAMEDCRHPITEAGIGPLLDTLETRWTSELDADESRVAFHDELVDSRPCTRIDVTHTRQSPDFMFHQVHLYIDRELGLPIRFEAYDWPATPDSSPALLEEYTYSDLKLNVGLGDVDFDASNADYAFGRF